VEIRFTVTGRPVPKARPCFGQGGRVFTPAATIAAERAVASAAWAAWPKHSAFSDRPCEIDATFIYAVPASWPKHKRIAAIAGDIPIVAGSDIDNLLKTVLDGLNSGPITDDSRVIAVSGRKAYGLADETRVVVRLLHCACGKSSSPASDLNPKALGDHAAP
jgi:Holliday junction resolvase RusA-like endonuclease